MSEVDALQLKADMAALLTDCLQPVSAMANFAALIWERLPDLNWAGFYLRKGGSLYLGPFQGKVACTVIPMGRGVCGTAAAAQKTQLVPDVHRFPGHIACDSASNSEVVVPLMKGGELLGVLDLDSPSLSRFSEADARLLEELAAILMASTVWDSGLL